MARCATRSGSPIPRHTEPPGPTAVFHVKPRRRPVADRPPLDRKPLTDNSPAPVDLVPISPCPGLPAPTARRSARSIPRRPPAVLPSILLTPRASPNLAAPIWPRSGRPIRPPPPTQGRRGAYGHRPAIPCRAVPSPPSEPAPGASALSRSRRTPVDAEAPHAEGLRTNFSPHRFPSAPSRLRRRLVAVEASAPALVGSDRPRGLASPPRRSPRGASPHARAVPDHPAPSSDHPAPSSDHLAPSPSPLRVPDHSHVLAAVPATTKRTAKPTSSRRCASDQGRTGALRVIHTGYPQAPTVSRETPRGTGCRPVDDAVCSRPSGAVDIDVST